MQSSLLGLLITAILASASPHAPAAGAQEMQRAEAEAQRQYQMDKSRCRATAVADEGRCVLDARARYRRARETD
jgi:hypothetical protein